MSTNTSQPIGTNSFSGRYSSGVAAYSTTTSFALGLVVLFAQPGSVTTVGDTTILQLPRIAVPIVSSEPVLELPDQYVGVPRPSPTFDTSGYGPDLTFEQRTTELEPLEPSEVLRAVYLGHDIEGEAYYIWHEGSEDFLDFIGQIIAEAGLGKGQERFGITRSALQDWIDSLPI